MDIEKITTLCKSGKLRWTKHILTRSLQRGIGTADIEYALQNGEIIESYPNDYPYPSCLIMAITPKSKPLHIVCGINDNELWLITAYYPTPEEWSPDFKTRKEF